MGKPEDVPQDVWRVAIEAGSQSRFALFEISASAAQLWGSPSVIAVMNEQFARAIMAERERCGKYATDQAEREPYGHCKATAYLIADNIMGAK